MNSTIAVSIDAGGIAAASMNSEGIPTLIAKGADGHFVMPLELGSGRERLEIGHAARCLLDDDPSIVWAENLLSLLGTDQAFQSGEQLYTANDLVQCLIRQLQSDVEQSWLGPFRPSIVAVSSDLNHLQRSALIRAFRKVGVDDIRLVDSAIAASFHAQSAPGEKPVLICEMQHDRVQASLIQVDRTVREMLAIRQLRIDEGKRIHRVLAEELKKSVPLDSCLKVDANVLDRAFKATAGSIIESILCSGERSLRCRKILVGSAVDFTITGEQLGAIGEHYFEKAGDCLTKCLDEAGKSWNEIEAVCFVGELSGLAEFVENFPCFASIPNAVRTIKNARFASVYGAAVMGQGVTHGSSAKSHSLSLNHLGLRVRSDKAGGFSRLPLIKEGTQLPTIACHTFKTSRIDQERLVLEIVEGTASDYRVVKIAEFGPLFPQSDRHPIEVRFQRDEQGLLKVTAMDGITKQPIHSCLASTLVGVKTH
jgi:molecular chaperone DnaK (HSP70)